MDADFGQEVPGTIPSTNLAGHRSHALAGHALHLGRAKKPRVTGITNPWRARHPLGFIGQEPTLSFASRLREEISDSPTATALDDASQSWTCRPHGVAHARCLEPHSNRTMIRLPHSLSFLAFLITAFAGFAPQAQAQVFAGDLIYSRYAANAGDAFRIKRVAVTYDGQSLTLGTPVGIALGINADGLVFSPRGTVLVAGQSNRRLCEVDLSTGATLGCSGLAPGNGLFHATLDPDGTRVWSSAQPGNLLFEIPLTPLPGTPITHRIAASERITQLAFTPVGAFYTSSGTSGAGGSFGFIDLTTFTVVPHFTNMDGFHGVTYDSYTGHVIAFGNKFITQIDPDPIQSTIVSRLDIRTLPGLSGVLANIDQGTSNGAGLIFAAVNGGNTRMGELVFLDIRQSRLVGMPDFAAAPALDTNLDDVAPLSGAGCSVMARAQNFGAGWAGTQGVPTLTGTVPTVGQTATVTIGNSSNTLTAGCILLGESMLTMPTSFGGSLLVGGPSVQVGFQLPSAGTTRSLSVPPILCGTSWYLQVLQLDPTATQGIAFSPGLELRFGL